MKAAFDSSPLRARYATKSRITSRSVEIFTGRLALVAGAAIMLTFILFSLAPSLFTSYSPKEMFTPWLRPCAEHVLGTNDMGYDIFTELVYATGRTLTVGLVSALVALAFGSLVGILAGYGGILGSFFNGLVNVFLMIPKLPVVIVLAAFAGGGQLQIILIIATFGWVGTARAVRAKVLSLKNAPFIDALKAAGYSPLRITFGHILPNVREVAVARYVVTVASSIMTEATLSFLGMGDVSSPTWGTMINFAYNRGGFLMEAYNWLLAPGVAIMLLVLSFYFINYFLEHRISRVSGGAYLD